MYGEVSAASHTICLIALFGAFYKILLLCCIYRDITQPEGHVNFSQVTYPYENLYFVRICISFLHNKQ